MKIQSIDPHRSHLLFVAPSVAILLSQVSEPDKLYIKASDRIPKGNPNWLSPILIHHGPSETLNQRIKHPHLLCIYQRQLRGTNLDLKNNIWLWISIRRLSSKPKFQTAAKLRSHGKPGESWMDGPYHVYTRHFNSIQLLGSVICCEDLEQIPRVGRCLQHQPWALLIKKYFSVKQLDRP